MRGTFRVVESTEMLRRFFFEILEIFKWQSISGTELAKRAEAHHSSLKNVSVSPMVARWFVFKPKMPIWVNFGGYCNGSCGSILWPFWSILRSLGTVGGHLVYFMVIWYIFGFGMLYQEKYGNPVISDVTSFDKVESFFKVEENISVFQTHKATRCVVNFYCAGVVTHGRRIGSRVRF
jgi:hypothetical protein